jgi:threonylcarbamoyladenosine tRNA methylthiotransferase MtaB
MQKSRIAFHTLGCKLNFSETSTISRQFGLDNFEIVDFDEFADVYVVHTCSVTSVAEKKCRAFIKQAHKRNPNARIAVIGCAVQANPDFFLKMDGVNWALGNQDKFKLGELISIQSLGHHFNPNEDDTATLMVSDMNKTREFVPSYSMNDRTRSFFKVQDGCDYYCTYCSIPFMRGRSRSNSVEGTMEVARDIAKTAIKEIILTGVNIGHFGNGTNEHFIDLLNELNKLDGIDRIRISSIEPDLLTDEIIELVAHSKKLMPHFHIPLQSGNDKVLALMKRRYRREIFAYKVNKIQQLMPDACIAADVIVGFPGETRDDFLDTCQFIQETSITYLHIFTFSERPGTKAIQFEGKVSDIEKHRRSIELHHLSEVKKKQFYESQLGKSFNVLWESDSTSGWMHGWTENYIHVRTKYSLDLINQITSARLVSVQQEKELICDVEIMNPHN